MAIVVLQAVAALMVTVGVMPPGMVVVMVAPVITSMLMRPMVGYLQPVAVMAAFMIASCRRL
ncbi:MAG: hypothetical protein Hals2KO_10980 [Halioglobus sp.]